MPHRSGLVSLTFATASGDVDLSSKRQQDFTLAPLADVVRQLPGDLVLASLPDDTPEDARLKTLVHNNCTGCHTPSYPLQHKFDAAGWSRLVAGHAVADRLAGARRWADLSNMG